MSYGGYNFYAFTEMPDLENMSYRQQLQDRITFSVADMSKIDLEKASIDIIFVCNALLKDNKKQHFTIMEKWLEALKPQGLIFIRVHNNYDICNDIRNFLIEKGLTETKIYKSFTLEEEGTEEVEDSLPFWVSPKKRTLPKNPSCYNRFFQIIGSSG